MVGSAVAEGLTERTDKKGRTLAQSGRGAGGPLRGSSWSRAAVQQAEEAQGRALVAEGMKTDRQS
eukprot:scaffold398824_cov46-Prasinocladus_malaysianus.AAC.1